MFLLQFGLFWILPVAGRRGAMLTTVSFVILMCYGGGFGTMPAFAADYFGSKNVGPIYGLMLTAWGAASAFGPLLIAHTLKTTGTLRERTAHHRRSSWPCRPCCRSWSGHRQRSSCLRHQHRRYHGLAMIAPSRLFSWTSIAALSVLADLAFALVLRTLSHAPMQLDAFHQRFDATLQQHGVVGGGFAFVHASSARRRNSSLARRARTPTSAWTPKPPTTGPPSPRH